MRLADYQSQQSQKDYQRDSTLKEIVQISKENQNQLARIETQLEKITAALSVFDIRLPK
jgi:hypothetical protein